MPVQPGSAAAAACRGIGNVLRRALDESADQFAGIGGVAVLEVGARLIHSPLM